MYGPIVWCPCYITLIGGVVIRTFGKVVMLISLAAFAFALLMKLGCDEGFTIFDFFPLEISLMINEFVM